MSSRFWGITAAILSVFFGSTYSIFSKYLLQFTIPETLILISQIFAIVVLLLSFGLIPEFKNIWRLDKKSLIALFFIALFSGILKPLFFMKWLSGTLAINAIVASRLSAIFLWIIWFVWIHEKFTWKRLLGTSLMFIGILYIVTQGFSTGMSVDVWVLWVVASALMSALWSVVYKKFLSNVKAEVVLLMRYSLSVVVFFFMLPFVMDFHHNVGIGFQWDTWVYFVWIALIPIVLSTYLRYDALDHAPASLVGAIDLLKPVSWMILAYIFLHEGLYWYHLWGTLLLFLGLIINLIKDIQYKPPQLLKKLLLLRHKRY